MLISRAARDLYSFDLEQFTSDGQFFLTSYQSARTFAAQISKVKGENVPASDIHALCLLDEVLWFLLNFYVSKHPEVLGKALSYLGKNIGDKKDLVLIEYTAEFPSIPVYLFKIKPVDYLMSEAAVPGATLKNLVMTSIANKNPALLAYKHLQDDTNLKNRTPYGSLITQLRLFFNGQPGFESVNSGSETSIMESLEEPSRVAPDSLEGQLKFLLEKWGQILGEEYKLRLLRAMDILREDRIRQSGPSDSQSQTLLPVYDRDLEYERYSQDREWMPRLVLIAKNTYVWLEQLSRKYQRWIRKLDEIPEEELDLLAARGFTGLWLIGLWERSLASQSIKQRMGDAEAVASAYSLKSYDIAADLGGWEALHSLQTRAWQRGIRLSADMVPNHMGIDSNWVIEHPDWFIGLSFPPYPSYSFNTENLSEDGRVGIYLEEHYYNRSDAAVVFQRRDQYTGEMRYIYHGNDGTSYPWNDTAQLDYTRADVREAVIQTILHVARNFPVIRFDAAMTLTRRHIQRLWFPEPGAGGVIPSRAEHGLTLKDFESKVPNEFWREVVDRVAAEVPDTLLLAEAFWLMEGYFVRTLGMHRVYNSAFMHMLRDEDNGKYRQLIKSTLEFDPQILKRYVNFMNNPDEKSAVDQFGNGDKYFGICTLLSTMPGLPMFGHGQVEGFHEKYGMEFRKPKWDEAIDEGLVRGHEWKIFPLLHRRQWFAEVNSFYLFDFFTPNGNVNEDVFAYSNYFDDQRSLIIYHNKFADTSGWIKVSAAVLDKGAGKLKQTFIAEALQLPHDGYAIFTDYVDHQEFIRSCSEIWEKGIYAELGAYQCNAFLDWRLVTGEQWHEVCESLNGSGSPSVQDMMNEMITKADKNGLIDFADATKKVVKKSRVAKKVNQKQTRKKIRKRL
jgi:glycosidase